MRNQPASVLSGIVLALAICSIGCGAKDEDPKIEVLSGKAAADMKSKMRKPMVTPGGAPAAGAAGAATSE